MILKHIIIGWKNLAFRDPKVEDLALSRAVVCETCEELLTIKTKFLFCSECGCYMPAKTRDPRAKCPLGLW